MTRSPIELKKIIAVLAEQICNIIVQTTFWIGFERATSENPFDEVLAFSYFSQNLPDEVAETRSIQGDLREADAKWVPRKKLGVTGTPFELRGLHHFSVYSVIKLIGLEIVSLGQGKLIIMYHLTPIHRMGLPIQIGPSRGNMGNAFLVIWEQEFLV